MNKAKVLIAPSNHIIDSNYGSEITWAYHIIEGLSKEFDITCFTGKAFTKIKNVKFIETGIYKRSFIYNLISFFLMYIHTIGKAKDFDIIHHMFLIYVNKGFNLLSFKARKFIIGPIQYTGLMTLEDQIWLSKSRPSLIIAEKHISNLLNKLTLNFRDYLVWITRKKANAIVFDSYRTMNLFKRHFDTERKILKVIPPPVETKLFEYKEPNKDEVVKLLTVGYLTQRKGIEYLLHAMREVVNTSKKIKLTVVGEGPAKLKLMKLTKRLNLENFVEFKGRVNRYSLPRYYQECDIYVHPSLFETFPYAIREAMSCGRPVIATRVGVIDEYFKHGINGYLVECANVKELTKAIIELMSDYELRYKIGLTNRREMEEKFSVEKIQDEWIKLYYEVLAK